MAKIPTILPSIAAGSNTQTSNYAEPTDFGQSKYDKVLPSYKTNQESVDEGRGNLQPTVDKLANSVGQMGTTAASSFLGGTVGLADMIVNADLNSPLMSAIEETNQSLKKNLFPLYKTKSEKDGTFSEQFFSDDNWLEGLSNGIGFIAGGIGAGGVVSAPVKALSKLPLLSKIGKIDDAIKIVEASGKSAEEIAAAKNAIIDGSKVWTNVTNLTAATAGRVYESALESKQTYDNALANGATEDQAKEAQRYVFGMNMMLSLSDFIQYGKYIGNKADDALKINNVYRNATGGYVAEKLSPKELAKKSALEYLTNTAQEGGEEAFQAIVGKQGDELATKEGFDNKVKALSDGFLKSFSDPQFYLSAALGSVLGAGGHGVAQKLNKQEDVNSTTEKVADMLNEYDPLNTKNLYLANQKLNKYAELQNNIAALQTQNQSVDVNNQPLISPQQIKINENTIQELNKQLSFNLASAFIASGSLEDRITELKAIANDEDISSKAGVEAPKLDENGNPVSAISRVDEAIRNIRQYSKQYSDVKSRFPYLDTKNLSTITDIESHIKNIDEKSEVNARETNKIESELNKRLPLKTELESRIDSLSELISNPITEEDTKNLESTKKELKKVKEQYQKEVLDNPDLNLINSKLDIQKAEKEHLDKTRKQFASLYTDVVNRTTNTPVVKEEVKETKQPIQKPVEKVEEIPNPFSDYNVEEGVTISPEIETAKESLFSISFDKEDSTGDKYFKKERTAKQREALTAKVNEARRLIGVIAPNLDTIKATLQDYVDAIATSTNSKNELEGNFENFKSIVAQIQIANNEVEEAGKTLTQYAYKDGQLIPKYLENTELGGPVIIDIDSEEEQNLFDYNNKIRTVGNAVQYVDVESVGRNSKKDSSGFVVMNNSYDYNLTKDIKQGDVLEYEAKEIGSDTNDWEIVIKVTKPSGEKVVIGYVPLTQNITLEKVTIPDRTKDTTQEEIEEYVRQEKLKIEKFRASFRDNLSQTGVINDIYCYKLEFNKVSQSVNFSEVSISVQSSPDSLWKLGAVLLHYPIQDDSTKTAYAKLNTFELASDELLDNLTKYVKLRLSGVTKENVGFKEIVKIGKNQYILEDLFNSLVYSTTKDNAKLGQRGIYFNTKENKVDIGTANSFSKNTKEEDIKNALKSIYVNVNKDNIDKSSYKELLNSNRLVYSNVASKTIDGNKVYGFHPNIEFSTNPQVNTKATEAKDIFDESDFSISLEPSNELIDYDNINSAQQKTIVDSFMTELLHSEENPLESIKTKYEKLLDKLNRTKEEFTTAGKSETVIAKVQNQIDLVNSVLEESNFNKFVSAARDRLKLLNFEEDPLGGYQEIDDVSEQLNQMIEDSAAFEDRYAGMPSDVKVFINTLFKHEFNSEGELVPVKNKILAESFQLVEGKELDAQIKQEVANKFFRNSDELIDSFINASNPNVRNLGTVLNGLKTKRSKLINGFFKTYASISDKNPKTLFNRIVGKAKLLSADFLPANRNEKFRVVYNNWKSSYYKSSIVDKEGNIDSDRVKYLMDKLATITSIGKGNEPHYSKFKTKRGNYIISESKGKDTFDIDGKDYTPLKAITQIYKELGIDISTNGLSNYLSKSYNEGDGQNLFRYTIQFFENTLDRAKKDETLKSIENANLFLDQSERLNSLARAEAKFSNVLSSGAYRINGNTYQTYTRSTPIDDHDKQVKESNLPENQYTQGLFVNPLQKASNWLKTNYSILERLQSRGVLKQGKGSKNQEVNSFSKEMLFIMDLLGFQKANVTLTTVYSDKKDISFNGVKNKKDKIKVTVTGSSINPKFRKGVEGEFNGEFNSISNTPVSVFYEMDNFLEYFKGEYIRIKEIQSESKDYAINRGNKYLKDFHSIYSVDSEGITKLKQRGAGEAFLVWDMFNQFLESGNLLLNENGNLKEIEDIDLEEVSNTIKGRLDEITAITKQNLLDNGVYHFSDDISNANDIEGKEEKDRIQYQVTNKIVLDKFNPDYVRDYLKSNGFNDIEIYAYLNKGTIGFKMANVINGIADYIAADYAINSTYFAIEDQISFLDPALRTKFKTKDIDANIVATFINLFKRNAGSKAQGERGNFSKNTDSYNVTVVNDIDAVISTQLEEYSLVKGEKMTDAQELITLLETLENEVGYGKVSKELLFKLMAHYEPDVYSTDWFKERYNEAPDFTEEQLSQIAKQDTVKNYQINPEKPVQFGKAIVGETAGDVYIKSSAIALSKNLVENSALDSLRKKMYGKAFGHTNSYRPRIVFKSGLKSTPTTIKNLIVDGKLNDEIFEDSYAIPLSKSIHYRRQLEVPLSEKTEIDQLSQATVLLWVDRNLNDKVIFEGKETTIGKVKDIYKNIQETLVQKHWDALLDELEVNRNDNNTYSFTPNTYNHLMSILTEEGIKRGYSANTLEGLKVNPDTGKTTIPLIFSNNLKEIEPVLMSIVSNRVIKNKLPGTSAVQVSEIVAKNGIKTIDEVDSNTKNGIVYVTKEAKDSSNLKYTRLEEGKVHEAEIIVNWNFRDKDGKLLNINRFIDKETGYFKESFPKELLEINGVRIPTAGYNAMTKFKIVGFTPNISGQIAIVPSEIAIHMGSDYDVDKLYIYNYNYRFAPSLTEEEQVTVNDSMASIKQLDAKIAEYRRANNLTSISNNRLKLVQEALDDAYTNEEENEDVINQLELIYEEEKAAFENNSEYKSTLQLTEEEKDIYKESVKNVAKLKPKFEKTLQVIKPSFEELENVNSLSDKELTSGLVSIHNTMVTRPEDYNRNMKPQGFVDLQETIATLNLNEDSKWLGFYNPFFIQKETADNQAGKIATGITAATNTAHANAQQAKLFIKDRIGGFMFLDPLGKVYTDSVNGAKTNSIHFYEETDSKVIEDSYKITSKDEEKTNFDKKSSWRLDKVFTFPDPVTGKVYSIADLIGEYLSAAVDNAKEKIVGTLGLNNINFGVALSMTRGGFSPNMVAAFINQPILKEYYTLKNNRTNPFESNPKDERILLEDLIKKYGSAQKDFDTQSFEAVSYSDMVSNLKEPSNKFQVSALKNFIYYSRIATELQEIHQATNTYVKGVPYNMVRLQNKVIEVGKLKVDSFKTIGNTNNVLNDSIIGFQAKMVKPIENLYSNILTYNKPAYTNAISNIMNLVGKDTLYEADIYKLINSLFSYSYTHPDIQKNLLEEESLDNFKDRMYGKHEDNLIARLEKLKEAYPDIYLLNKLSTSTLRNFNDIEFITLNQSNEEKSDFERQLTADWAYGMSLKSEENTKDLHEFLNDLAKATVLFHNEQYGKSNLIKYLPFEYFTKTDVSKVLNDVDSKLDDGELFDKFSKQFIQHHPTFAKAIDRMFYFKGGKNPIKKNNKVIVEEQAYENFLDTNNKPVEFIRYTEDGEVLLFELQTFDREVEDVVLIYNRINTAGEAGFTEYNFGKEYANSIFNTNQNESQSQFEVETNPEISEEPIVETKAEVVKPQSNNTDVFTDSTPSEVLSKIQLRSTNSRLKYLAEVLQTIVDTGVPIEYELDNKTNSPEGMVSYSNPYKATFNKSKLDKNVNEADRIVLHETLHVIWNYVKNNNDPKFDTLKKRLDTIRQETILSLTKEEKNQFDVLNESYTKYKDAQQKEVKFDLVKDIKNSIKEKGYKFDYKDVIKFYGLVKPEEFFTEALTRKEFQDLLESKKTSLGKSLFSKFKEFLNKLVSIYSGIDNSKLTEALNTSFEILDSAIVYKNSVKPLDIEEVDNTISNEEFEKMAGGFESISVNDLWDNFGDTLILKDKDINFTIFKNLDSDTRSRILDCL